MVRKVKVTAAQKLTEPKWKQETKEERAKREGNGKKFLQSCRSLRFLKLRPKADVGNGITDWPRECQPVSGCQIPSAYKL